MMTAATSDGFHTGSQLENMVSDQAPWIVLGTFKPIVMESCSVVAKEPLSTAITATDLRTKEGNKRIKAVGVASGEGELLLQESCKLMRIHSGLKSLGERERKEETGEWGGGMKTLPLQLALSLICCSNKQ
ncbi:hypothetical protein AAY473_016899 [Plecturocebus cupreus]